LRGGKTRGRATGRVPEAYIGGYPKGLDFGAGSAHARPRVARTIYAIGAPQSRLMAPNAGQ
jgi:hypothetical protein